MYPSSCGSEDVACLVVGYAKRWAKGHALQSLELVGRWLTGEALATIKSLIESVMCAKSAFSVCKHCMQNFIEMITRPFGGNSSFGNTFQI